VTITESTQSPEAPPAEPTPRTLSYRLLARITDVALDVVAAAATIFTMGLVQVVGLLTGVSAIETFGADARLPLTIAAVIAFHFYNNAYLVSRRGASLAKGELGLAIDRNEALPSLPTALIREVVSIIPISWFVVFTNRERHSLGDMAAATAVVSRDAIPAPGVLRDVRALKQIGQIVAVAAVSAIGYWLINNLLTNLDEQGIGVSFDFLSQPTNFQVPFDPGFDPRSPVRNMVWVGVKNTLIAASVGILIAVVLGTIIGIARLSTNWLVAKLATIYVEVFRNIPPLIIIIFFGAAVFTNGPFPILSGTSSPNIVQVPGSDSALLIVSNTVVGIPSFSSDGPILLFWLIALAALALAVGVWRWRTRINIATGDPHHRVLWSFGVFTGITVIAFIALQAPYVWSFPAVAESGRRIDGGFVANFGWISVTLALGLYTASHIAEIIRGSILAVHLGQNEAANALALSNFQRYRFVILPQAMRTAIPPTINQFLNLTKNTSLGIAVAYAEITALTKSSIGNGRPAVPSLVVLVGIYLVFSIVISTILNRVNKKFQLVGR